MVGISLTLSSITYTSSSLQGQFLNDIIVLIFHSKWRMMLVFIGCEWTEMVAVPLMHMSVLHNRELWYMTFKFGEFEINICVGENGLQLVERL